MEDLFKQKYRTRSPRAPWLTYKESATYFLTICTKNRRNFFGEIINNEMRLALPGYVAQFEWLKTPQLRPDMKISLGDFIVMPNHFHALLTLGNSELDNLPAATAGDDTFSMNKFGRQSGTVSTIVRGFKGAVTSRARQVLPEFAWQPGFYDHVVRSEDSFRQISEYIIFNPERWEQDMMFKPRERR